MGAAIETLSCCKGEKITENLDVVDPLLQQEIIEPASNKGTTKFTMVRPAP